MKSNKRKTFTGIPASSGIALGKIYKYSEGEITPHNYKINRTSIKKEKQFFIEAIDRLKSGIAQLIRTINGVSADILEVHLSVLNDVILINQVLTFIEEKRSNAAWAFYEVINNYIHTLENVEDDYLRERVSDLKDIRRLVLKELTGSVLPRFEVREDTILCAKDIMPTDMANFNKNKNDVVGFALELGGGTSHSVIMARSLGIPGLAGVQGIIDFISEGGEAIIDGTKGTIIVNPNAADKKNFYTMKNHYKKFEEEFRGIKDLNAVTTDGRKISLLANIEIPIEVETAILQGAEGVGLFRTEYLFFMKNSVITEEEQIIAYNYVVEKMGNKPVTIRIFDIGGDKIVKGFWDLDNEVNSFMGLRAIRILLKEKNLFLTQLRAIIKSSINNPIRILVPLITDLWEIKQCIEAINNVKSDLIQEGHNVNEQNISFGIMVEVPSAAIMLDDFLKSCKEIKFVAVGTNDLIQFLLAVDRSNEKVNTLYNPYHPSLLRTIKSIVDTAHKHGITVEVCGEIANSQNLSVVLLGMGVDELSMAPFYIPYVKRVIRSVSYEFAKDIVDNIMVKNSAQSIEHYVKSRLKKYVIGEFVHKRRKHYAKH